MFSIVVYIEQIGQFEVYLLIITCWKFDNLPTHIMITSFDSIDRPGVRQLRVFVRLQAWFLFYSSPQGAISRTGKSKNIARYNFPANFTVFQEIRAVFKLCTFHSIHFCQLHFKYIHNMCSVF